MSSENIVADSTVCPSISTVSSPARLAALHAYEILDTDFEDAFDEIVSIASTACNAPVALISFVDESRQWFKARIGLKVRETPLEMSMCRHVLLEHDTMVINDTWLDKRTCTNPLALAAQKPLRFYAGALIRADDQPLGSLCVLDHVPRQLTPEQLHILKTLRNQVVRLLDYRRMNLNQQKLLKELDATCSAMQHMAQVDALTGLPNRRVFELRLAHEAQLQKHAPRPTALMVIDADHFKRINDTHGHLAGDQVLNQFAGLMRSAMRSQDTLCRWGGEEFVALLPGLTVEQAGQIAQRIHAVLAASSLNAGGRAVTVSASIGLTQLNRYDKPDDALQRADAAMYRAKAAGRSCTVTG
jgi:diguanylate cyclase (GGDEF)-like protein